jgi:hypothetical protein
MLSELVGSTALSARTRPEDLSEASPVSTITTAPAASPSGGTCAPGGVSSGTAFLGPKEKATRSSAAPTGQAAQIPRPRRPSRPVQNRVLQRLRSEISLCRSLPTGMAIRRRRLAPVSLRLLESLRRPADPMALGGGVSELGGIGTVFGGS